MASSQAAFLPALDGLWITSVFDAILDLARGDIPDQLGELERVARTFDAFLSHIPTMAWGRGDCDRGLDAAAAGHLSN